MKIVVFIALGNALIFQSLEQQFFWDLILKTLWGPFGDPFGLFLEKRQWVRSKIYNTYTKN